MSDFQMGVTVIDYQMRLVAVMQMLESASLNAHKAAGYLGLESGFYDGEARAEMKGFFESYAANVDKMTGLVGAAAGYLSLVMETIDKEDLRLAGEAWASEGGL